MMKRFGKLVFIDLETTGPNPSSDFITEIGIVEVSNTGVTRWSTLLNPQVPIPPFIQHLTGIRDDMVQDAPTFALVCEEVRRRLQDGLFIAHNARFDYGFLRNAFRRCGVTLRNEVLCTIKLSRKLFPLETRHSLDALMERHGLSAQTRHRALADADLLWQFWRKLEATSAPEILSKTIDQLLPRRDLPEHLGPELDEVPDTTGVYMLYGEHDAPLYIGYGTQLRQRVLSHFQTENPSSKDAQLAHQVRRIDWHETAGEIGAQLIQAQFIRNLRPLYGSTKTDERNACSWHLRLTAAGRLQPVLVYASELDFGSTPHLYGLFNSRNKAEMTLQTLAETHEFCLTAFGMECLAEKCKHCCHAHQVNRCEEQAIHPHQERLEQALAPLKLTTWPYAGPVGMVETGSSGQRNVHVVNNWCYLGTLQSEHGLWDILEQASPQPRFDIHTYKTLIRALARGKLRIHPLSTGTRPAPIRIAEILT